MDLIPPNITEEGCVNKNATIAIELVFVQVHIGRVTSGNNFGKLQIAYLYIRKIKSSERYCRNWCNLSNNLALYADRELVFSNCELLLLQ